MRQQRRRSWGANLRAKCNI